MFPGPFGATPHASPTHAVVIIAILVMGALLIGFARSLNRP